MYAIISNGELLSMCDKPRYVRRNDHGIYVEADKEEAIAIAINGTLYNIRGGDAIPDAQEAVAVQWDAPECIFGNRVQIKQNEEAANTAITELENAACDLDMLANNRISEIEEALCDLDSMLNGGGETNE